MGFCSSGSGGVMAVCLGSIADSTGSNPAMPLYISFSKKFFSRIYSVDKGRLAAGSIATAILLISCFNPEEV